MSNNNERNNYLMKNTIIFAVSNIATKLIMFFLVPLYTYCLSSIEYGIIDLLFTISSMLIPILTLNISEAIYRFSIDKDEMYTDNKIMSISFVLSVSCIFLGLFSIPVLSLFPQYSEYKIYFYFYVISSAISQISLSSLKGQEKLKLFSVGNIINTLLIAVLNIIFLVGFKMRIEGYFLAYILSNIFTFMYSFIAGKVLNNLKNFNFDKKIFIEMTKYSIILIPTSFLWWIMNSSDRIMLTTFLGSSINGIYAISYKIPTILITIVGIFNQAWMFSAVSEKNSNDKEAYINRIFSLMFLFILILSLGILTFLKPFFKIYVSSEFFTAWKYVPFLLFGSVFMTLGTFISTQYNVYKDSKGFVFSALVGAITNIILNFIMIPQFKVYGAALATCISYIVVFIYRVFDTKKYVRVYFNKEYIFQILLLIIGSLLVFISDLLAQILQIVFFITVVILYRKKLISIFNIVIKIQKNRLNDKSNN